MASTVPFVDLGAVDVGRTLAGALESASAAVLVGHGIDPSLRAEVMSCSRRFFSSTTESKAAVRWPGEGAWGGWQPVDEGCAHLAGTSLPDLVERFGAHDLATFSRWPDITGFQEAWAAYYQSCHGLASRLIELLAAELDLPRSELGAWTAGQFANLVASHYPSQPEPPPPGQTRVGAHTDRGGITLLAADEAPGGLEVRLGEQVWVPLLIPSDAYVLQVGDLFARWTNRRIAANVHRVVNPRRDVAASASRLAMLYFHYPSLGSVVSPAPSCVDGDHPALGPVLCRDHLMGRQNLFGERSDDVIVLD